MLDDLFTYRLGDDRFLTVTNAATTRATSPGSASSAEGFDVEVADRLPTTRCSPSRAPRPAASSPGSPTGELPERFKTATLTVAGAAGVLVCGTGYTGEDGVELLVRAASAPGRLGRASSRPARSPPGSARATRCAWRSASTSTATT